MNEEREGMGHESGIKKGGLRVQICSDLHLEMFPSFEHIRKHLPLIRGQEASYNKQPCSTPILTVSAPVLALLGDIGCVATDEDMQKYSKFLLHVAQLYENVLLLSGNHEYYVSNARQFKCRQALAKQDEEKNERPKTAPEIDALIQALCDSVPNLHYLNNQSIVLQGVRVVGTTLWSEVPEDKVQRISFALNDYSLCFMPSEENASGVRRLTVQDTNQWHKEAVRFLEQELVSAEKEGQNVLCLSHHAPSFNAAIHDPKYVGSPIGSAFCTELTPLFAGGRVHTWCFGHTHFNVNKSPYAVLGTLGKNSEMAEVGGNDKLEGEQRHQPGGTLVVANQFGYVSFSQAQGYKPDFVVHIERQHRVVTKADKKPGLLGRIGRLFQRTQV